MKNTTTKFQVKGVTFENRQNYIHYLMKQNNIHFIFSREPENKYDKNAVKILGYVPATKKCVPIGYVPKEIAKNIAPMLDKGMAVYTHSYSAGYTYNKYVNMTLEISLYQPRKAILYAENE